MANVEAAQQEIADGEEIVGILRVKVERITEGAGNEVSGEHPIVPPPPKKMRIGEGENEAPVVEKGSENEPDLIEINDLLVMAEGTFEKQRQKEAVIGVKEAGEISGNPTNGASTSQENVLKKLREILGIVSDGEDGDQELIQAVSELKRTQKMLKEMALDLNKNRQK